MDLLRNAVRPYAWGSRTAIADLLGRPVPAPHPEAELWLGAHPADPSLLVGEDGSETSLLDRLTEDPTGQLGPDCAGRWGGRLPFLMKVLAADEPLSLQAHPSAAQAAEGFAREEAAGIPLDAPNRNYKDPNHKPELICALTEFHALAGFRDAHRTLELLKSLEVPALRAHIELLAAQPDADGLRALFTTWITLPQPALDKLVPQVLDGCVAHLRDHGPFDRECRTALELAEAYPGDAGVLAALLLNRIVLHPGEAIYLPAGNLHAYLHGTGVEIMANSDNVLRGGLTPKHVDVPELLRVLDFRCGDVPVLRGDAVGHLTAYRTPAPEFHLSTLDWTSESGDVEGEWIDSAGPQILLCTAGAARLTTADGRRLDLARGQSVWVAAADPSVLVEPVGLAECGRVQLFRATAGVA
ncbi:mannose-6-phosphate isomerase, type 1 [Streptoalloteichus tenebrarius]|uniref:mannose-6-phosphate isomerase n=1 Tax=Streptoalloteichus tenebrarius (strain ATCC 17920 / DSM 40477 / JCM 4838 / CBS 697.72 / NBRC 16177 / NCIMB 11028 / NRRL B-12390 / A12253. 1 / ISP 5477) TaxID=1933 RepID=A0ABT1HT24_STRSD|nr:mannose-6-phosphate isomerase, class I [Streptoalloteichus tenebrarius]MCP2258669.1 mannose-6-phosphate isomerase, type 1 [Streptoalloteichus tenebrarius]